MKRNTTRILRMAKKTKREHPSVRKSFSDTFKSARKKGKGGSVRKFYIEKGKI